MINPKASETYQGREDLKGQNSEKRQGKHKEVRPKVTIYFLLKTFPKRPSRSSGITEAEKFQSSHGAGVTKIESRSIQGGRALINILGGS